MWLLATVLDSVGLEDAVYTGCVPQHRAFLELCLSNVSVHLNHPGQSCTFLWGSDP